MTEELRKLAEAADPNWYSLEQLHEMEANPIEGYRDDAAFIAASSPAAVLALLDDRDEARAAVKRLAGALASAVSGLEYCRDLSERQDVINCATGGVAFGDKALADPVVRRIVEGE